MLAPLWNYNVIRSTYQVDDGRAITSSASALKESALSLISNYKKLIKTYRQKIYKQRVAARPGIMGVRQFTLCLYVLLAQTYFTILKREGRGRCLTTME